MDEISRIEDTPNYPHGDAEVASATPAAYAVVTMNFYIIFVPTN